MIRVSSRHRKTSGISVNTAFPMSISRQDTKWAMVPPIDAEKAMAAELIAAKRPSTN